MSQENVGKVGFLRLPSEVRNSIYMYAETLNVQHVQKLSYWGIGKCPYSEEVVYTSRPFLGLTGSCRAIRAEYRPIWLRSAQVQVKREDLNDFIDRFYPTTEDYVNAPQALIVDMGYHPRFMFLRKPLCITRIMLLRSHRPSSRIEFSVTEHPPSYCCMQGSLQARQVNFTLLNRFLQHDNMHWLSDLEDGKVSQVKVGFEREFFSLADPALFTVFIDYKPEAGQSSSALQATGVANISMNDELFWSTIGLGAEEFKDVFFQVSVGQGQVGEYYNDGYD